MTFPDPKPGLVIRYSFLWSNERAAGATEGRKDRPCAIVVAAVLGPADEIQTIVAPITHATPVDTEASVEIPKSIALRLGLGERRQWIRIDELNRFSWPGFDLRPIPGTTSRFVYGMIPEGLFETLRKKILERQSRRRVRLIPREG